MTKSNTATLPLDKFAVGLAFLLALGVILGAWGSQIIGHLVPCELCWGQRVPYYFGVPLLALLLIGWNRLPLWLWYIAIAAGVAIFAWSFWLGAYHAGVEWTWWPGPTACTGAPDLNSINLGDLTSGNVEGVIPCDQVQFRDPVIQFSLAGWNAVLSAVIAQLLLLAAAFQAGVSARR